MKRFVRLIAACTFATMLLAIAGACGPKVVPPVVSAPHFPDFIVPTLTPADPRLAPFEAAHDAAWQFLQAGDLSQAEKSFQAVLKRTPSFYPSEAALGYVELARKDYPAALDHFDLVLQGHADYVSALAGRGETLLAESREPEALAAFEAALRNDPTLSDIGRRVEVLKARAAEENVVAARQAAQAGRLDEAVAAYQQAIADSPESAFLFRDLAEIEARQSKPDQALEHYRKAIQLEPGDVSSRVRVGELLEARGDIEGALTIYNEAVGLDPRPEVRKRIAALEARAAYLRLPAEYRALPDQPAITRGDLAALIGIRLAPLLATAPPLGEVVTDTRNHWAAQWIMAVVRAGVMDAYENHTFQPRSAVRRSDLAQAVSRLLKLIAAPRPELLKQWQGRQAKMADVGVSNLNYADASLSVSAGILPLVDGGQFGLSRQVSGQEALDAVSGLERLYASSK
jgi:predicted negative regulator of RcsB-dependent stress response